MNIDLIKSSIRNIESLGREYRERIPEETEIEIDQLKSKIKSGYKISPYDKQFLADTRQIKRDIFKQVSFWAVKLFNEIDNSVGAHTIEYIDPSRVTLALKELPPKEGDFIGLAWELLFKIESPGEPLKKIANYANYIHR